MTSPYRESRNKLELNRFNQQQKATILTLNSLLASLPLTLETQSLITPDKQQKVSEYSFDSDTAPQTAHRLECQVKTIRNVTKIQVFLHNSRRERWIFLAVQSTVNTVTGRAQRSSQGSCLCVRSAEQCRTSSLRRSSHTG